MLGKSPLYKFIILISFFLLQSCVSKVNESTSDNSLSCGDLFSIYAEKPDALKFQKCSKGTEQTLFDAEYFVSKDNASEVEEFLVEKYDLIRRKDYYYSMPYNEAQVESAKLKKIDPHYVLLIIVDHDYRGEAASINPKSFRVNVKILDI